MSVDSNEIFIKKEKKSRLKVYSIFDALPKEYYQQNHWRQKIVFNIQLWKRKNL